VIHRRGPFSTTRPLWELNSRERYKHTGSVMDASPPQEVVKIRVVLKCPDTADKYRSSRLFRHWLACVW
jgi:hypothetical protein